MKFLTYELSHMLLTDTPTLTVTVVIKLSGKYLHSIVIMFMSHQ